MDINIQHVHIEHFHESNLGSADRELLNSIDARLGDLMAGQNNATIQLDRLKAVTDGIAARVDEEMAQVNAEREELKAKVADLQQQLANGQAVSDAQLQEVADAIGERNTALEAISEHLKSIGTDPTEPLPEPPVVDETPATEPETPTTPIE